MGEPRGRPPDSTVDPEKDYFTFHREFWIYLFREEGTCFNDIETKEAHAAFRRFATVYNAGNLEEPYYTRKFPSEVIPGTEATAAKPTARMPNPKPNPDPGPFRRPTAEERLQQRRADRRLGEDARIALDELTGGRKEGKERQWEKKRERSTRIHGAFRDREEGAAAGIELSDADLFGASGSGGDKDKDSDSFRAALARSKHNKERANERRANRIEELKAKEQDRQANMLKRLGLEHLQGQTKLEIAPRKDPPK
eukprot:jgi/Psemu1/289866/fgenesh1_pg.412_\